MLVIHREQMNQLEEFFKDKFIHSVLKLYPTSNYSDIKFITNEALNYKIESESDVKEYIKLYLENIPVFKSKPSWMLHVLKNNNYSIDDKLNHIERNIKGF